MHRMFYPREGASLGGLGVDQIWFRKWLQLGGLRYTDAVTLHPYYFPAPTTSLIRDLSGVRSSMAEYGGDVKPVWITEQGWPTGSGPRSATPAVQATQIAQSALLALQGGVTRYYVYDFIDDGLDPADYEDNFGLLHNYASAYGAYTPKPAYAAYAVVSHELTGARYERSEDVGANDYDLVFARGRQTIRGLWTMGSGPAAVAVHATGPITVTDMYGDSTTRRPDAAGVVALTLTGDPVYLTGDVGSVTAAAG